MARTMDALLMDDAERAASRAREVAGRETFKDVFDAHAPHVWRAVRGLGVREADVEDVCQEVFVIVHRKLPEFEQRSSLRTWTYGIVLRVVADYRKKAHRKHERLVRTPPEIGTAAPQEQALADRQSWALLESLLAELSDEQRRVFVLYELEQLPMREIASLLACPLQTAYSRLESARAIVQKKSALLRLRESRP